METLLRYPLLKKEPSSCIDNYRPVSITSYFCRLFEKVLKAHIFEHLDKNSIIPPNQHGFMKGKSTESNLLECINDWTEYLEEKKPCDIVYCDFSKAFDRVEHGKLLLKLSSLGLHPVLIRWLTVFLNDRTFQTAVVEEPEFFVLSVKTSEKFHKTRLEAILDTWYKDASDQVYFFTDALDGKLRIVLEDHLIETNCSTGHDRWSCHFDDDNYVNVQALRRLLSSRNSSLPWYIGKSSTLRPLNIPMKSKGKIPIWFATGGAGICLSQALLEKLGPYTEKQKFEGFCDVYMLPDDVTLGFIITNILNVPLTVVQEFHSHLEPLHQITPSDVPSQISFGGSESSDGFYGVDLPQLARRNGCGRVSFQQLHSYIESSTA